MITKAKFAPGTIVKHKSFGYLGMIFDVDAVFSQSDEWYEKMAASSPPKDRPWYHVMVDGENHTTYVAEENLKPAAKDKVIDHPLFSSLFTRCKDGVERLDPLN